MRSGRPLRPWQDRSLLGATIIIAWQGLAWQMGPYWISSPLLVAERFFSLCLSGELWFHARFTIVEALVGFVIAAVPAAGLAMSLRMSPRLEAIVEAIAEVGYAIPKAALVPLFILWFGVGAESKVALVACAIFFIVFYSTLRGVKAVDAQLMLTARVMGASEWQLAKAVIWPSIVPFIFGGLRVAVPYAIASAVVGEIMSSNRGIGYLTQYGAMDFDTTLVFTALAAVMVIILVINGALGLLQRRLLRWRVDMDASSTQMVGS